MNIEGKHALITGGIRGIGLEIGKALLRNKLQKLCLIDIFEDQATIEELRKEYPDKQIIFEKCDVTRKEEIERCYKLVFSQFNRFDILVNSAGIVNDLNVEQTLMVNTVGLINSSLCAIEYMSIANTGAGGFIVNIASICGLGPTYFIPVYTSSKYAVIGFTRSMGHDYYYNKTGVKYIAICPGVTLTNIFNQLTDKLVDNGLKQIVEDQVLPNCLFQDIGTVSDCVVQALAAEKNGSVFICDSDKIKEVELTELVEQMVVKDL